MRGGHNRSMIVRGRLRMYEKSRTLFSMGLKSWKKRFVTLDTKTGKIECFEEKETAAGISRERRRTLLMTNETNILTFDEQTKTFGETNCFGLSNVDDTKRITVASVFFTSSHGSKNTRAVTRKWLTALKETLRKIKAAPSEHGVSVTSPRSSNASTTSGGVNTKLMIKGKGKKNGLKMKTVNALDEVKPLRIESPTSSSLSMTSRTAEHISMSKLIIDEDAVKSVESLANRAKDYTPRKQSTKRLLERANLLQELMRVQTHFVSELVTCMSAYKEPLEDLATRDYQRCRGGALLSAGEKAETSPLTTLNDGVEKEKNENDGIASGKWDNVVSLDDVTAIFSPLDVILGVNRNFLNELSRVMPPIEVLKTSRRDDHKITDACGNVAGAIVAFAPFFTTYIQYTCHFGTATKALDRMMVNTNVNALLREQQGRSDDLSNHTSDLNTILSLPLIHLFRLRVLIAKLAVHTDRNHEDLSILLLALYEISQITEEMDRVSNGAASRELPIVKEQLEGIDALIALFRRPLAHECLSCDNKVEDSANCASDFIDSGDDEDGPPGVDKDDEDAMGRHASSTMYDINFSAFLPDKLHPEVRIFLRTLLPQHMQLKTSTRLSGTKEKIQSTMDTLVDGTRVRHLASGAIQVEKRDERSRLLLKTGGVCRGHMRDGSRLEIHPDGITLHHLPDNSKHQYWPDGSSVHLMADGTKMQRDSDGTDIFIATDGTITQKIPQPQGKFVVTEKNLDGSTTTYFPGGAVKLVEKSGRWAQLDADGTKIEILPDMKTRLQTNPDGVQIFSSKNGTSRTVLPDGSSTTRFGDGTIKTICADGAVKTTYSDGTVLQIDSNGREHRFSSST